MLAVISAAEMREFDRATSDRFGTPSLTLMENAGAAAAQSVTRLLAGTSAGRTVLVLCGKGNNGGDGAVAARLLATAGARVDVILFGRLDETKGDARNNFDRLRTWKDEQALREERGVLDAGTLNTFECESDRAWEQLQESLLTVPRDVVIDALFGSGLTRPVEGVFAKAIDYVNNLRASRESLSQPATQIVSIDIPSGLDADRESPIGANVRADVTVTMTAPKRANVIPPASDYNGRLIVAEIGSPDELIAAAAPKLFLSTAEDAQLWLTRTRYTPDSYKNTHGHVMIVAGSRGFTGAAALCANAAMRSGAGLVTIATPVSAQSAVAAQAIPEVMTTALAETDRGAVSDEALDYACRFARRADVVAIGPGLTSEDERTRSFVRSLVRKRQTPIVIDADGLNSLAPWPADLRGSPELPIVLTPHPGEMLRLLGTEDKAALEDRVACAREFAVSHQVILVLKGPRTLIALPDGRVVINATGNPGLGTAGAGDTLTGVIAGCLAQAYGTLKKGADAAETVVAAVYISGLAGDLAADRVGMRSMVASDIRKHLSRAIRQLDPIGERPHYSD
jgi:NAD(P)H-hydrate epimerase